MFWRKSNTYYVFWVCVCNLTYPTWNALATYCHPWPVRFYNFFFTLSHKRRDFRKRKVLNIKCVFRFSLQSLSETFLIVRRTEPDMIKNVNWSSCKVPVFLVRFYWNLNFFNKVSKNTQISHFIKIRPVRAKLSMRTDGQTDRQIWRS